MDVMDLVRIFWKKKKKEVPLPPIRTVQEPGAVRKERIERQQAEEEAAGNAQPQSPIPPTNKVPDNDFFDTGSLEMARDPGDGDNPYDTQSWQVDSPQGPRRVDDLKAVNKKRKSGEEDNPYDTIVTRKGW